MNPTDWIGTGWLRLLTVLLAGLAAVAIAAPQAPFWLAVVLALVALVAATHWSAGINSAWMRFAEGLQRVVMTLLFSIIYFTIVPPMCLITYFTDSLRLRDADAESYWTKKRDVTYDLEFFQRLG